jgi:uncharacterized membrane protein
MTLYEFLLALHVIAAIIWLGAGFVLALQVFAAERAGAHDRVVDHHADVDWLSTRLFIPASLATLLLGFLVVAEGSWSLDQLWIVIGLGGWLASFLIGILVFKPAAERIAALREEERGPNDPELAALVRRVNIFDRIELLVLFLVAADMVIKPTGDDTGVLLVGAALIAIVGAATVAALRREEPPAPLTETAGPPAVNAGRHSNS